MKKSGQLSYTFLHETDTLPSILAKMESIRKLELRFNGYPVNIPAWMDKMNIGELKIVGEFSDEEEAQLRQQSPQIDISNIRKWKMIGEEGVWREYPTKEENPEKEDMITNTPTISIDEALEGRVAYDSYDIRQILE